MLYLTKAERLQLDLARGVFQTGWVSRFDRERMAEAGGDCSWLEQCAAAGAAVAAGRQFVTLGENVGTACRWAGIDRDGQPGTGTLYALASRRAWFH